MNFYFLYGVEASQAFFLSHRLVNSGLLGVKHLKESIIRREEQDEEIRAFLRL